MHRRDFLGASLGAGLIGFSPLPALASHRPPTPPTRSRVKHSVCRWCYGSIDLDTLCQRSAEMGAHSVELLTEKEWSIPAKYGITCAVAMGPTSISRGYNRPAHHDEFTKEGERLLPLVKDAAIPNMIVFSGNRAGMDDAEGLKNCAAGLRRLTPLAESLGVTIIMELLNSKVDHKDYMCDRTRWGVNLVEEVASDRFRLLYDIYHMQIMEGDVIRTLRDNIKSIAHIHTGGVPGRREIDETQELFYPAIVKALMDAGYTGYVGQEFIPSKEAMASLKAAIALCDV